MSKHKFTLIEVLVVVAIIGILASLLLPALGRARDSARRASCVNQQKQIGIAFALYQDDNNGYYPVDGQDADDWISWDDQLGDYDGRGVSDAHKAMQQLDIGDYSNDLYECPSNMQSRSNRDMRSYSVNNSWVHDLSDPNAVRGVSGWHSTDGPWSISSSEMGNPSKAIVMTEIQFFSNIMGHAGTGGVGYLRGGNISGLFAPSKLPKHTSDVGGVGGFYVHDDKSYKLNFLHGDGHVEFRSAPRTLGTYSDSFYTGTDVSSANLIDTDWNALR